MTVNPKQSVKLVRQQLAHRRKRLAEKQGKLAQATHKPHITRLQREIASIHAAIAEYEQWLRERGENL